MIIMAILQMLVSIISIPFLTVLLTIKVIKESVRSILTVRAIERDGLEDEAIKETYSKYTKIEIWLLTYLYLMRQFSLQIANKFGEFFNSIVTDKVD